jgi:hypothetical protein
MAIILGEIDTLKRLIDKLCAPGLDFKSLEDIFLFQTNWKKRIEIVKDSCKEKLLQEIAESEQNIKNLETEYEDKIKHREEFLKKEKEELISEMAQYSDPQVNLFKKLYFAYKKQLISGRKRTLELDFENEVKRPLKSYPSRITLLTEKVTYNKSNIDKVVADKARLDIKNLEETAAKLEVEKDLLYGAIGEQRALAELKKLPDKYQVINDFRLEIDPPLHKKNENGNTDYIKSIQIDHIVIGPSGVFVLETKNWSKESTESPDLFSPIMQLSRSSYALYIYLQHLIKDGQLQAFVSNWGEQKIPLKNILLMMDKKPSAEYPHVKILTLSEVIGYITYFETIFSDEQVKKISDTLFSGECFWQRSYQPMHRGYRHTRRARYSQRW